MMDYRKEDFEPHLATIFEVAPVGMAVVPVELVEVLETASTVLSGFSLLFRGASDAVFRHDTHPVRHPAMGEFTLFLGPVHTGRTDGIYYQAIFNAPRQTQLTARATL